MMFKLANISLNSFFCSLYDAVYFGIKFNVACLIDGRWLTHNIQRNIGSWILIYFVSHLNINLSVSVDEITNYIDRWYK